MNHPFQIVFCTCPDEESAEVVANHLVDERLAACVNVMPNLRSVYRWHDEVKSDNEVLLIIKTMTDVYPELEQAIIDHHPYELPEVISVPITDGQTDYLAWIRSCITIKETTRFV
jgi:periplasmic divalent cation tolerance protein